MKLLVAVAVVVFASVARSEEESTFQQFAREHPKDVAAAFSVNVCMDRRVKSDALAEISKEKKYSRLGGVVDKEKLYGLQRRIRWSEEQEAEETRIMRTWKEKMIPCNSPIIQAAMRCAAGEVPCDERTDLITQFITTYDEDSE